jgi:F0F1-type ATP synthase membrane subunit b/b'
MRAAAVPSSSRFKETDVVARRAEALKAQGAEDVRNEKARIAAIAATERERLMAQARREIDMSLRIARRELIEQTATLAVGFARDRITRTITPEDQIRLVDRYTGQLGDAR